MKSPIRNPLITNQGVTVIVLKLLIIAFCLGHLANSFAETGNKLIINESLVNMRAEPAGDAEILLKLSNGREVTEIQRQGNWIEIETHRDDVKTGWIHKSLLINATAKQNTTSPTRFDHFMQRYNEHKDDIRKQNGIIYFTEARHKGQGELELVATQDWLTSEMELQNNTLSEIFKLWSDVTPVGSSISIQVFDELGEKYTVMMR